MVDMYDTTASIALCLLAGSDSVRHIIEFENVQNHRSSSLLKNLWLRIYNDALSITSQVS